MTGQSTNFSLVSDQSPTRTEHSYN